MREKIFTVTIADCEIETFRAGGKGGQNQNKTESGVRIRHRPSGAVGEARDDRSQLHNKQSAFRRMAESKEFQWWVRCEASRRIGTLEDIAANVDKQMEAKNLKIESKDENGRWVEGMTEKENEPK